MKKTRNSNRDNIKKKIEELLTKQNKKEEISQLKKQIQEYNKGSSAIRGSSKLFEPQLNTLENDYKIQQELLVLLTEPVITDETIAHYTKLVHTAPSQQLLKALQDKKKSIEDAKQLEDEINKNLKNFVDVGLQKFIDECVKIQEKITIYENNPYRDIEKLDKFNDELFQIEKKKVLISDESKALQKSILSVGDVSEYSGIKDKIQSSKSLSSDETNFLKRFLIKEESLHQKSIDVAVLLLKEMGKPSKDFHTISDIEKVEKLLDTYKKSKYSDLAVLFEATAFVIVLQDNIVPMIRLKQVESFFKQKQIFKKRDIEMLKTMLDEIPVKAFFNSGISRNKLELYQMIYSHLVAELNLEKEMKEAEKGFRDGDGIKDGEGIKDNESIKVDLNSIETNISLGNSSNSQSDREGISILSNLRKQKTGKQRMRDLLLQQPLQNIPVIFIGLHGAINYSLDEGVCHETIDCPLDVLFRVISTAPGEPNVGRSNAERYSYLLDNEVIEDPTSTVIDAIKEKKENTSLDNKLNKFVKVNNAGNGLTTNINFKSRNQLVINYRNTKMCKKYYSRNYERDKGIFVLNTTEHLESGTDLVKFKPFIDFIDSQPDANQRKSYVYDYQDFFDNDTKYAEKITNDDIYKFLKFLGYKQAVIMDDACENNYNVPLPTFLTQTSEKAIKALSYLNIDATSAGILIKLTEKKIYRDDPTYKTHKQETKKIGKRALPKSKHHRATIAKDNRGKR